MEKTTNIITKRKKKEKSVVRHFQLKIRNKDDAKAFDRFQKKMIYMGRNVTDMVMDMIDQANIKYEASYTLVHEPEMLRLLKKHNVSRTRQSLHHMRGRGELKDPATGTVLWGTDGKTIVYCSEAVIKLLKEKGKTNKKQGDN